MRIEFNDEREREREREREKSKVIQKLKRKVSDLNISFQ